MTITASNFDRKQNDLYETEEWATEALLRMLPPIGGCVWEPAAGNHKIADVLLKRGMQVQTSDFTQYEREHSFLWDFLAKNDNLTNNSDSKGKIWPAIITNPPYGKGNRDAVNFSEQAIKVCDVWVALLLTAKFDFGNTRRHLFANNPRFWGKIALLDRISWAGNGQTGTEDHAWYVWSPLALRQSPRLYWEGKNG